eukprot:3339556-Prymnesium_polylepis.1
MFSLEAHLDAQGNGSGEGGDLTAFATNAGGAECTVGALRLRALSLEQHVSPFDLTLSCHESGPTISSSLQYNAALFDGATASRISAHFLGALQAVTADARTTVGGLALLSHDEKRSLLAWGRGRTNYAVPRTIVDKLHEQLEATPHALALQGYADGGGAALTYEQLHARAAGLALQLLRLPAADADATPPVARDLAGKPMRPVAAICTERSLHFVVAALGGLKAGFPYLPLDRTYPRDRLVHMMADSAAAALLTTSAFAAETAAFCPDGVATLKVDEVPPLDVKFAAAPVARRDGARRSAELEALCTVEIAPSDAAYLVYTSGSTGKPKAIQVAPAHSTRTARPHWLGPRPAP